MRPHLLGVDHVVILINDIDAAQAAWSRLGFNLTPRGFHSIGTRNHCMMFGSDYVELLSVVTPHPVTQYFSEFLAGGDGAAAFAFSTDDSQACWASLRATGIEADAPVDFSRPVELDGGRRDAKFRVTQLPIDATPGCRTFLCQHFTPDLVWLPPYQRHPLGVTGIAGITVVTDDVEATAAAYAKVAGVPPVTTGAGSQVPIGSFVIEFEAASAQHKHPSARAIAGRSGPVIGALHLRVGDLDTTRRALRAAGSNASESVDGVLVLDDDAINGVALTFRSK
jgi:Glyoxalase-like domain